MYSNQNYDMDCITWAPSGRILQVEYAMKAVEQGEAVLGLRSEKAVVLCAIKRAPSELSEHQEKIFKIDSHMCIGIAGLTADGYVLADYMRDECLNAQYVYSKPMNVGRLVAQIADKSQAKTQSSSKRPYGVGLLVAGVDEKGPHLYQTCPSGAFYEYHAMAIGGRSTSAKTYLEKHLDSYKNTEDPGKLIQVAVEALNKTTSSEVVLSSKNVSVVIVDAGGVFREVKDAELQGYLDKLEKKKEDDEAMADASAATPAA